MPVLDPNEYDAGYFDGVLQSVRHNAGYGRYRKWPSYDDSRMTGGRVSQGEYWLDIALELWGQRNLTNQHVLEIGCAKGFLVEALVDLGVDAYGLDVSPWCVTDCPVQEGTDAAFNLRRPDLAGRVSIGDVRTALDIYKNNEWNYLISRRLMECIDPADLPGLVADMNRVSRNQVHVIQVSPNPAFYTVMTLDEWLALDWANGTVLVNLGNANDYRVK